MKKINGSFDYLRLHTEINVKAEGEGNIVAILRDTSQNQITFINKSFDLDLVLQTINIDFDGKEIFNHGIDGPYFLKNVYIYHTGDVWQPDFIANASDLQHYYYSDFDTIPGTEVSFQQAICQGDSYSFEHRL